MSKRPFFLAIAAMTLSAAPALAAPSGPMADLDKNGEVSRAEFMAISDTRFQTADRNFDGQLDQDELKSLRDAKRAERERERFKRMDANGDGVITQAEMEAASAERAARRAERREQGRDAKMRRLDVNRDGVLSDEEKARGRAMLGEKRRAARGDKERRRGDRPRLDANRDGLVTRAEYDAMSDALFTRMDADGNGVLTQGEGRKRMRKRRGLGR